MFVKERRFGPFVSRSNGFVSRETRTATAGRLPLKNLAGLLRNAVLSGILLVAFAASVNLLVKYVFTKVNIGELAPALPKISLFSQPKYLIRGNNYYIIYSDGSTKFVDGNIDSSGYPTLTGIGINEGRAGYKQALKQALAVDKRCLKDISEVILSNPRSIMMITTDGARILFGDSITREKLDNYIISLDKMNSLGKSFRSVDLRFKNRVIIN